MSHYDVVSGELSPDIFQTSILSSTEIAELNKLLQIKYAHHLEDRTFQIRAGSKDDVIYVEVLLSNTDESYFYPVHGRMEFDAKRSSKKDAALFLVDYIDQYFFEYFREQVFLPIDWQDFDYQGVSLQLKGQVLNLSMEREATRWLEEAPTP